MSVILAKNWWSLVIRGLVAISLGLITVVWPGISLGRLVLVFFVYVLIDGLLGVAGAARAAEEHERWGPLLIEGLAGIATAIVTIAWPTITALSLVYVIAAWALVTGVLEIKLQPVSAYANTFPASGCLCSAVSHLSFWGC